MLPRQHRLYQISPKQMGVHIVGESLALMVLVPLSIWIATRQRELSPFERSALLVGALVSIAVDGTLLYHNVRLLRRTD